MSLQTKTSFAGGELDPALRRRVTLEKYNSGIAKGRNCIIGKTGRIINTPGTTFHREVKVPTAEVIITAIPFTPYLVEFGDRYIRVHDIEAGNYTNVSGATNYDETQLVDLHFCPSNYENQKSLIVFLKGESAYRLYLDSTYGWLWTQLTYTIPGGTELGSGAVTINGSTGYTVEYVYTYVASDGQESTYSSIVGANAKPVNAGESNLITITTAANPNHIVNQPLLFNIYSRPTGGGAFGYLGSTSAITAGVNDTWVATYQDLGEEPDYTHSPPDLSPEVDPDLLYPKTGAVVQSRLLLGNTDVSVEAIEASRVKYEENFYKDYPLSDTSALSFKCGSSGAAEVLRLMDNGALIAFTTIGIFANDDAPLNVLNTAMKNKAEFVIDEHIPPLKIPGALLFVDVATNVVRSLIYNNDNNSYDGDEISIFSNHLFQNRKIVSWSFQGGDTPLVWVIFDDGEMATLTYQKEQKMQAWTPQDTDGEYKSVATVRLSNGKFRTFFVVERNGTKTIEYSADRFPEDQKDLIFTHSTVTRSSNKKDLTIIDYNITADHTTDSFTLASHGFETGDRATLSGDVLPTGLASLATNDCYIIVLTANTFKVASSLANADAGTAMTFTSNGTNLNIVEVAPNGVTYTLGAIDWNASADTGLTITAMADVFDAGMIGEIWKFFTPEGIGIELTITGFTNPRELQCESSENIPENCQDEEIVLWSTFTSVSGLDHLNGKQVSVVADGAVISSPNNNEQNYDTITVSGGSITLPDSRRAAIIHVGLPYVSDVQTLAIDSIDGKKVLLENKLVNRVVLEVIRTRGLYLAESLPDDDTVTGMTYAERAWLEADPFNTTIPLRDTQVDVFISGEWNYGGTVVVRQVDPLPFEILAIIPDLHQ